MAMDRVLRMKSGEGEASYVKNSLIPVLSSLFMVLIILNIFYHILSYLINIKTFKRTAW